MIEIVDLIDREHVELALLMRIALSRNELLLVESLARHLLEAGLILLLWSVTQIVGVRWAWPLGRRLQLMVVREYARRVVIVAVRSFELRHVVVLVAHDQLPIVFGRV